MEIRRRRLASLSKKEELALRYDWSFWAREKQLPPPGAWFCWLIRSGRGFGKTRTGAEFVIERAKKGYKHIALIGKTKADVRDTMIEVGDSSILKCSPPWFMPKYEPSKRRLVWPNGATGVAFSGDDPDQLRGPEHDTVWIDELAKMRYPQETWDNMELGLRLGPDPRVCCTTTPRPIPIIKSLLADPDTVDVVGSSYENQENLSPHFIKRILRQYDGTRLGIQEIYGGILDDVIGALWNRTLLEKTRVNKPPELTRIVVAVDPAATTGETGIVVAGKAWWQGDWHGFVLDDLTLAGTPGQWGSQAVAAYHKWQADAIVGEINNGGDMVEHVIRTVEGGKNVRYISVRASRGKQTRAEPVVGLFERGHAHHVGQLADLEDQLCSWVPGEKSPDRLDAEVWALTELLVVEEEVEEPLVVFEEVVSISPF
jgi:phage terminase large subunit-like protein